MSIELHITATNAHDLHVQLRALLMGTAVSAQPDTRSAPGLMEPLTPEEAAPTAATRGPRATKANKVAKPEPEATTTVAETPAANAAAADPGKQRNEAVALLRAVYAQGEAGEKAVTEVCAKFGVTKLADVPLAKAGELLVAAQGYHVTLVGPVPA